MKYLVQQKYRVKSADLYWNGGYCDFCIYVGKYEQKCERSSTYSTFSEPSESFVKLYGFDTVKDAEECMKDIEDCYHHDIYPNHYLEWSAVYECDTEGNYNDKT